MQADWEVEIGGEAPIIDALWPGCIDLRAFPERVIELIELRDLPQLAEALVRLNRPGSPVWTSKCDVWTVAEIEKFDRFELDAPPDAFVLGGGCYIDLLPARVERWAAHQDAVEFCRQCRDRLRAISMRSSRVDLIVREALSAEGQSAFGITAYVSACGATESLARGQLQRALSAFVDAVVS